MSSNISSSEVAGEGGIAVGAALDDRDAPVVEPSTMLQRLKLRSSRSHDSMDVMIPPDMVSDDEHGNEEDDDEEEEEDEDEEDPGGEEEALYEQGSGACLRPVDGYEEYDRGSDGGEDDNEYESEDDFDYEEEDVSSSDGVAEAGDDEVEEHHEEEAGDEKDGSKIAQMSEGVRGKSPRLHSEPLGVSQESSVVHQPVVSSKPEPSPARITPPNEDMATSARRSPNVVHDRGLEFDMDEPWQRSLLRQFQAHYDRPRVRSPAVLVAVGHTESRDFALDVTGVGGSSGRDDLTLTTEGSSTFPRKPQAIHRPWILPDDYEDGALFEDDTSQSTADPNLHTRHPHRHPTAPKANYGDSGHGVSPRSHREERDASCGRYSAASSGHRPRAGAGTAAPWLEMELPSGEQEHGGDFDDATTVAVASNQDACFCMGYNVLDLWMPPASGNSRTRAGGRSLRGGSRRGASSYKHLPHHLHPTSRRGQPGILGRVAEEGSSYHDGPVLQPSRSAARSDPDGAYNAHQYNTTTTMVTRIATKAAGTAGTAHPIK
jgi:hypothetical protein